MNIITVDNIWEIVKCLHLYDFSRLAITCKRMQAIFLNLLDRHSMHRFWAHMGITLAQFQYADGPVIERTIGFSYSERSRCIYLPRLNVEISKSFADELSIRDWLAENRLYQLLSGPVIDVKADLPDAFTACMYRENGQPGEFECFAIYNGLCRIFNLKKLRIEMEQKGDLDVAQFGPIQFRFGLRS